MYCFIYDYVRGPGARHLFGLLAQFKRGDCDGVNVRVGRLQVSDFYRLTLSAWSPTLNLRF